MQMDQSRLGVLKLATIPVQPDTSGVVTMLHSTVTSTAHARKRAMLDVPLRCNEAGTSDWRNDANLEGAPPGQQIDSAYVASHRRTTTQ